MSIKKLFLIFCLFVTVAATQVCTKGPSEVTTPEEQYGHIVGADYILLNNTQIADYWRKLAEESGRMSIEEMGKSTEGRPMLMGIITSPENQKRLARYKEISKQLALAEGLTDEEAHELAKEGRAMVWIDAGMHASEIVNVPALTEMIYQMVSRNDAETLRFLDDVILLAVCTNPDGLDLVPNWYMRKEDPKERSFRDIPRLYQKYIGHDNARDCFMANTSETINNNRILYREWFPQILYNQHQTGPAGTVLFCAPFRDPFNYNYDPLVVLGINLVGNAMHTRFVAEDKPGSAMRQEASYSTWWNGCPRCTAYFHNVIGILTEINGSPTPMEIPFIPRWHLPRNNYPYPIAPQKWHFRQAIDYLVTADRAVLDTASKHREEILFNRYLMGKRNIERGSRDHWTITPKRMAAVNAAIEKDKAWTVGPRGRSRIAPTKYYNEVLHDPAFRDARGYIMPSDQADFLTAIKFVNVFIKNGVTVHQATRSFEVAGKTYPEGSYIVKAAQAFRPLVRDFFDPQDHPDDIPCPGATPIPPYDNAGWTLAFAMGIEFDRIFEAFDGPFERIVDLVKRPAGKVRKPEGSGFLLSHQVNDSFIAINRLLKSGDEVYWLKNSIKSEGKSFPPGIIYIPAKEGTVSRLQEIASEIGLNFEGIDFKPSGEAFRLKPMRIGLWDRYGGSMPSGWIQWMFDNQFEFPYEVIFPPALDAGNLAKKYDALIFVGGAISEFEGQPRELPDPQSIPPEWRDRLADVTISKTVPQLRRFLKDGGTILTIGSSTCLGYHLGLPIVNHLVEKNTGKPLPPAKYFAPGSLHQLSVDTSNPLAYGLTAKLDVLFNKSPVFRLKPGADVKKVAWFDLENPLRSGWLWGPQYLKGGVAIIEADVGKGKLFLFGPEITNRAQTHGTFKFLFNGIYYGGAESVTL